MTLEALEPRRLMAVLPAGFVETPVAAGLASATAMEIGPQGDVWALEQTGAVKRFRPGSATADVVGNVSALGLSAVGERGLLGIAFDPQYATNKRVYLYYTATTPVTHNRISRFTVIDTNAADYYFAGASAGPGDAGSAGTPMQTIIFELDPLSGATNHNGGAIHFGPDGKLYAAVGDNATGSNAQTLANLHGKLLRLNADGSIPGDNPFYGVAAGDERAIWALGLRNPFTFAFQPGTGRMFVNDVGQSSWEEINEGLAGANYGWPGIEGNQGTPSSGPGVYSAPVYAYPHGGGPLQGFAITGGAFYNPIASQFPNQYVGDYFFADYVSDWINVLDVATGAVPPFATSASAPVDLRVDASGRLYYLARAAGEVRRIQFNEVPPEAIADTYFASYDYSICRVQLQVASPGVLANDASLNGRALQAELVSGPDRGTLDFRADGGFSYTPPATFQGIVRFTYQVNDGALSSSVATVTVHVTLPAIPPTILDDRYELAEDETLQVPASSGIYANDSVDGDRFESPPPLLTNVSHGSLDLRADGGFTYVPARDFFGVDQFVYDLGVPCEPGRVTLTVASVNDRPTFEVGPTVVAREDAGPQFVPGWATQLSAGPANEAEQLLSFQVTAHSPIFFVTQPAIDSEGNLTFTPRPNAKGTTEVSVELRDNGIVGNGGRGSIGIRKFSIELTKPLPWRNSVLPLDIDSNGRIQSLDALTIINRLNTHGPGPVLDVQVGRPAFYDPNGDNRVQPLDALLVINFLNSQLVAGEGEGDEDASEPVPGLSSGADTAGATWLFALGLESELPAARKRRR